MLQKILQAVHNPRRQGPVVHRSGRVVAGNQVERRAQLAKGAQEIVGEACNSFRIVHHLEQKMQLVLVVPTEGTREWSDHWKSGFYRIALAAKVPIVPSFLDFKRRQGGFGPALLPSDDVKADMAYFREFYRGMQGKFPEKFGPIRLQEEDDGA